MADNTRLPVGTEDGDTYSSDEIAGVKIQRVKIVIGADGVNDGDVASGNPMPVTGTVTASGPLTDTQLRATAVDVNITGGSSAGTEYTEDAAAAANPVGGMLIVRRKDTLSATEVSADGDNIAVNSTAKGEVYVKQTDAVPVTDNSGSLTVDNAGTFAVQASIAAAQTLATVTNVTTVGTVTNVVHVDDNSGNLSIDDGGNSITVDNGGTFAVQAAATEADGANVTLGAKADAKSTATDTTAVTAMSVLKQISASVQAPPSQAVTNAGTFAVQASIAAAQTLATVTNVTTLGTITNVVHVDDNSGNLSIDDGGNSITVDNAGTFAVQATVAAGATAIAKAEDVASADADVGVPAMMIRKATPANTSGTDGDYEMLQGSAGRLWVDPSGVTLTVGSHAVTNAGTFAVQAAEADGANVTLGAKADAKSTATDTTAVTAMSVLKQISASVQAPPSQAVTNAGTFAVQAAATEADGANVTLGAKADAKSTATDTTAVTAMSVLKQISASVQAPPSQAVTNAGTFAVQASIAAAQTLSTVTTVGAVTSITNTVTTKETGASTPAQSSVANSASNVTLLSANANRLGATIYNDDPSVTLCVKLGVTASSTSFTVKMAAASYYEVPFNYTGQIDAIASAGSGNARITELTA